MRTGFLSTVLAQKRHSEPFGTVRHVTWSLIEDADAAFICRYGNLSGRIVVAGDGNICVSPNWWFYDPAVEMTTP